MKKKTSSPPKVAAKPKKQTSKGPSFQKILQFVYPIILLFVFVGVYKSIYDKKVHLGGDNAGYYILGKSLAEGKGYTNIHTPQERPGNHFPPGYPVIIATTMSLVSSDIGTIKNTNGLLLFASLLLLFLIFRKLTGNIHLAFAVCLLGAVNYHLLLYSTIMMSEIPFLFFSSLTIFLFLNINFERSPLKEKYFYFFLLALVGGYYIRTAGIALFGGIFLFLLIKRNWRYLAGTTLGFVLLALPWFLRGQALGGSTYIKQLLRINHYRPELGNVGFGDLVDRFLENVQRYFTREIPNGLFSFIEVNYQNPIDSTEWFTGLLIIGLGIYGIVKLQKHQILMAGYLAGTFGILFLWPSVWYGTRFMLPLIPFLLLFVLNGIYELAKMLLNKVALTNSTLQFSILPFALLLFIPKYKPQLDVLHQTAKTPYTGAYKNYFDVARWAKANTPEDAVICCRKEQLFYLFADRRVVRYSNTLDKEALIQNLEDKGTTHVVLEQLGYSSTGRYLYPAIQAYPKKFVPVTKTTAPETYLLKFDPKNEQ